MCPIASSISSSPAEPVLGRRLLLGLGLALLPGALAGCGFQPLYAAASDGSESPAQARLAAIAIGLIPERQGQLLRQALRERFDRGGVGVARRYDLAVAYSVGEEGISIQPDTSVTYTRVIGTAAWTLRAQDPTRKTLATGTARAMDGYNYNDMQYFTSTLEDETIRHRLAGTIADQISLQVANWFTQHADVA